MNRYAAYAGFISAGGKMLLNSFLKIFQDVHSPIYTGLHGKTVKKMLFSGLSIESVVKK